MNSPIGTAGLWKTLTVSNPRGKNEHRAVHLACLFHSVGKVQDHQDVPISSLSALNQQGNIVVIASWTAGAPGEQTLPAGLPGGTWGWDPQHQAPSGSTARRKSNSWIASGSRWGWECHSKTLGYKLLLEGKKRKKREESKRVGSRGTTITKRHGESGRGPTYPAYQPASNTMDTFTVALTCHYFLWITPAFTA